MKVLFAASEAAPFFKSGGLGDVAGSLPAALGALGADVRVVLPLYQQVTPGHRAQMRFQGSYTVPLAWRQQYCGCFELKHGPVTYYFLDNEQYFKRPAAYGHFDDGERFAFFARAVLELPAFLDWWPDVLHANDWHTGLTPVYLRLLYADRPEYQRIKTVFTIHNIQYQGRYGAELLGDVFGLDHASAFGVLEWAGSLNLVKGAVVTADRVTTVSPTYAGEIQTPQYSHGLDGILRQNAGKLSGILNGIDVTSYNPADDLSLFANYTSADAAAGKASNKAGLQRMLGLNEDPAIPLLAVVSRLVDHKGMDLIARELHELMGENLQFVVLGTGDWRYEQLFLGMQQKCSWKMSAHITFSEDLARKIYAGSDLFLMPSQSEACGLSQLIALRYGSLPIVRETGGLKDTIESVDDASTRGNGFAFAPYNSGDMMFTIRRALEFFHEGGEKWQNLVARAMACDYSWNASARKYMEIYQELAPKRTEGTTKKHDETQRTPSP